MSVRVDLEKRIEKEKQKVVELKDQLSKAESFMLGLQEALKMLPKEQGIGSIEANGLLRPGSDIQKVQDLLRKNKEPMYIVDILKGINKPNTKENRASVGGSLNRYARKEEIFKRVGPNQFSLLEFTDYNQAEDLPVDFGKSGESPIPKDDLPF
jgi:hypothetical protein